MLPCHRTLSQVAYKPGNCHGSYSQDKDALLTMVSHLCARQAGQQLLTLCSMSSAHEAPVHMTRPAVCDLTLPLFMVLQQIKQARMSVVGQWPRAVSNIQWPDAK